MDDKAQEGSIRISVTLTLDVYLHPRKIQADVAIMAGTEIPLVVVERLSEILPNAAGYAIFGEGGVTSTVTPLKKLGEFDYDQGEKN